MVVRFNKVATVWLYPADSIIGGTIEPRPIIGMDERKVYYSHIINGSVGAKLSAVFFTKAQAKLARREDERRTIARNVLDDQTKRFQEGDYDD